MRKLLLGIGLLAVNRFINRRQPAGLGRYLSLTSLAGLIAANAAGEFLPKRKAPVPNAEKQAPAPAA